MVRKNGIRATDDFAASIKSASTTQLVAILKSLAESRDANIYRSIAVSARILLDHEWIGVNFKGDEGAAKEHIQDEYFRVIGKVYKIDLLLKLYERFPSEDQWRSRGYDLEAMRIELSEAERGSVKETLRGERTSWKKVAEEFKEGKELAESKLRMKDELLADRESELSRLRKRVFELEHENADVKARLSELEKVLQSQLAAA